MTAPLKRARAIILLCLSLLTIVSCRSANDAGPVEHPTPEKVVSSTPPFQTKEPNLYRARRTTTIVSADGKSVVTTTSLARDGEMRRSEFEVALKKVAYLDGPEGRIVLLPEERIYANLEPGNDLPTPKDAEQLEISPERLLHTESTTTTYEKIGTEPIGGRNANKYRIVVNGSAPGNVSLSETIVWIGDGLNMPIRSETRSPDGTRITTELSDISLDVDKQLFQVPDDYEKVTFAELLKRLRKIP
jgi:hypothetical protein